VSLSGFSDLWGTTILAMLVSFTPTSPLIFLIFIVVLKYAVSYIFGEVGRFVFILIFGSFIFGMILFLYGNETNQVIR
jgi:hypothetical protein